MLLYHGSNVVVSDQYSFHTDKAVECLKFVEALYV
jgi:hypothetical protein